MVAGGQHGEAELLRAVVRAGPPAAVHQVGYQVVLHANASVQTCFVHSKSNRKCFQVHVPLPLPKHLVIFGLGEWKSGDATISVDVVVSAELPAQRIGTLSTHARYVGNKFKKKKKDIERAS